MSKIALIDVDSKIPNLALMKISAYEKECGNEAEFIRYSEKYKKCKDFKDYDCPTNGTIQV